MVLVDDKLMRRRKRAGTCALSSDGWRGVPPGVNPGGSFCRNISQLPSRDANLVTTQTWGVTQRYIYSPYGSMIILNADFSTAPAGTQPISDYLYQGMTLDAVTGLYYARNRNYSPSLGVWISQDPAVYINGANTYQMEMSGPVGSVDPFGTHGGLSIHFSTGWQNNVEIPVFLKVSGWQTSHWQDASTILRAAAQMAAALAVAYALPAPPVPVPVAAGAGVAAGMATCVKEQIRLQGAVVRNWHGDFRRTWYWPGGAIEDNYRNGSWGATHLEVTAEQIRYRITIAGHTVTTEWGDVGPLINGSLSKVTPADQIPLVPGGTVYH